MSSNINSIHLGCRLNFYESEQLRHQANAQGLKELTIINSCAVTQEAVRQSRQAVRAARKKNPHHKIVLTGCAAEAIPEADIVIKNEDKLNFFVKEKKSFAPQSRSRALLKIQEGCDWQCTFCYTTKARGRAQSRLLDELLEEAHFLFQQGHREITLTGVDILSYGKDLSPQRTCGWLLEQLLAKTPAQLKFRLSSLDPAAIDPLLFSLLTQEKSIKPFVHLSVQSGDNVILKRMKRRHSREAVIALCEALSAARTLAFSADFIVGFPTESEAMFQNSKALLAQTPIAFAHIFPFSARENTKAALMPPLPQEKIKARARLMRELAQAKLEDFLAAQVGTEQFFLAEKEQQGRNDLNCIAHWETKKPIGTYHKMKVLGVEKGMLKVAPQSA